MGKSLSCKEPQLKLFALVMSGGIERDQPG